MTKAQMLTWNMATSMEGVEAKIGNAVYCIDVGSRGYGGNATWVIVTGPRGGKRRRNLGNFKTMTQAKLKCEQHWGDGCDMSYSERWRWL